MTNRYGFWLAPYLVHGLIGIAPSSLVSIWLGASYFLGMMSHPIQGWMVNSLGHFFGFRNFETTDKSRNYTLVAYFVAGEGYQNNHTDTQGRLSFL